MHDFVLQMRMPRVVFGAGSLRQVRHEVELIGAERALVLSTPGQKALAERVVALLGPHAAGVFSGAAMHVPVETVNAADGATLTRDQAIRRWAFLFGPQVVASVFQFSGSVSTALGSIGSLLGLLAFLYAIYLLYTVTQSAKRQGFHDVQANTVVVKRG